MITQQEKERICQLVGVPPDKFPLDENGVPIIPNRIRKNAFEEGGIYILKQEFYNKKDGTYKTTTRPVLVLDNFRDNDIQILEFNLIKHTGPFTVTFEKENLQGTGLYKPSAVQANQIKIAHSENLTLPCIGNIRKSNPKKFHEVLVKMRESLMQTATQEEIFHEVDQIQREIKLFENRLKKLEQEMQKPELKDTPQQEATNAPVTPNFKPGYIYSAEREFYDMKKWATNTKKRPILIIGQIDKTKVLVIDITSEKIDEKTKQVKYMEPWRQPFFHSLYPAEYPATQLTKKSWIDAGKPRTIEVKNIYPGATGNLIKDYPAKFHKILVDMKESFLEEALQQDTFYSKTLLQKEIAIVNDRIAKLKQELPATSKGAALRLQEIKKSTAKNKYASIKKAKNADLIPSLEKK